MLAKRILTLSICLQILSLGGLSLSSNVFAQDKSKGFNFFGLGGNKHNIGGCYEGSKKLFIKHAAKTGVHSFGGICFIAGGVFIPPMLVGTGVFGVLATKHGVLADRIRKTRALIREAYKFNKELDAHKAFAGQDQSDLQAQILRFPLLVDFFHAVNGSATSGKVNGAETLKQFRAVAKTLLLANNEYLICDKVVQENMSKSGVKSVTVIPSHFKSISDIKEMFRSGGVKAIMSKVEKEENIKVKIGQSGFLSKLKLGGKGKDKTAAASDEVSGAFPAEKHADNPFVDMHAAAVSVQSLAATASKVGAAAPWAAAAISKKAGVKNPFGGSTPAKDQSQSQTQHEDYDHNPFHE